MNDCFRPLRPYSELEPISQPKHNNMSDKDDKIKLVEETIQQASDVVGKYCEPKVQKQCDLDDLIGMAIAWKLSNPIDFDDKIILTIHEEKVSVKKVTKLM